MFDSKKLEKFAISIFPYVSDEKMKEQLSHAIDSYGIDSGKNILKFLFEHFKESFIRQFFNGTDEQFTDTSLFKASIYNK